jgi:hypothetical protein
MKRYKIQIRVFLICFVVVGLLNFVSFMGAAANDGGHSTKTTLLFEKLFLILGFPTMNLLAPVMRGDWGMPYLFFIGLFINAILYAFVVERLYIWIAMKRRIQTK